jgi:hypothetical protein
MFRGSIGFAIVSAAGFSVWAFAGKRLYASVGEAGLYAVCALVFLGSSGLLLSPLVRGPRSLLRFYQIFMPAFLAYAILWCAAWFSLRFGRGEWLGSLLGSLVFVTATGRGLGNYGGFLRASIVVFVCHSAGYFLGGQLMHWINGPTSAALFTGLSKPQLSAMAKLSWGLLYGLGFGAGIGYVFWTFQREQSLAPNTPA